MWRRFELLEKIEKLDPKAVDAVGLLKKWTPAADWQSVPALAEQLARRGDLSLAPSVRRIVAAWDRSIPNEAIWFLMRRGGPEDYRLLHEAVRRDLTAQAESGSTRVLGSFAPNIGDNPLAVPILVDLLELRKPTGSRFKNGKTQSFSTADTSMEALIGLTGHNEGYDADDEPVHRHAAMDAWTAWWRKTGQAQFLKNHPQAGKLVDAAVGAADIDASTLPQMVRVRDADAKAPLTYELPRKDIASLLQAKSVTARRDAQGGYSFQFASRQAALNWFENAKPADRDGGLAERSVVAMGPASLEGPVIAPDGRAWFWRYAVTPLAQIKRNVVEVLEGKALHVEGAEIVHVDRAGHVWLVPYAERTLLLAYDPKSGQWLERRANRKEQLGGEEFADWTAKDPLPFGGAVFESASGVLFFPDRLGVHVLAGADWRYQPLFLRNLKEKRYYGDHQSFNPPQFREDAAGNIYVWSAWGSSGWTGSIGYWVSDGKSWENIDAVERVDWLVPRSKEEVFLYADRAESQRPKDEVSQHPAHAGFCCWQGKKLLTGDAAIRALTSDLYFHSIQAIATTEEGATYFHLGDVTDLGTLDRHLSFGALLPRKGPLVALGPEAGKFLEQALHHSVVAPDGWLWNFRGDVRVQALSPDGKFRSPRRGAQFQQPRPRGADDKGNLYFVDQDRLWRFNAAAALDDLEPDLPSLPAMRIRIAGPPCADALGRMWCMWNTIGGPMMSFGGGDWRLQGYTTDGQPRGFLSVYPGADGAMVFEDASYHFWLFDAGGVVTERTARVLASEHAGRLAKALPFPPGPALPYYHHFVKDAKGRFWWSEWERTWGVVDGKQVFEGKDAGLAVTPSAGRVCNLLVPVGEAGRMLVGRNDGIAAIVDLGRDGIVKVADVEFRTQESIAQQSWLRNTLRDSLGRVWIMGARHSCAIGVDGKIIAKRDGWLALEDQRQGLWFLVAGKKEPELVRLDLATGKEARLEVPHLWRTSSLAQAPDGTVWASTSSEIIRIRAGRDGLHIIERHPVAATGQLWCDRAGRIWQWLGNELVCYATRAH
ncbi:MAG: hypothetical protein L0Y72_09010 [Gemmataceae bacterium]|nr:hypothetical protein [Gemmataceae bacterium]